MKNATYPPRWRFFAVRIALVFGSLLAAVLIAEILTRVFVPRYIWEFATADNYWQPDPTLGWVQKPNFDITTTGESNRPVRFRTNPDGAFPYTARPERQPGPRRTMVFGASGVGGRTVPQ